MQDHVSLSLIIFSPSSHAFKKKVKVAPEHLSDLFQAEVHTLYCMYLQGSSYQSISTKFQKTDPSFSRLCDWDVEGVPMCL